MNVINIAGLFEQAERARLMLANPRPTLALYLIAHEGVSGGTVVGFGRLPKRWTAARVEELASVMNRDAVPVFRGHADAAISRTPIGKVVKCFTSAKNGEAAAFAIVHIVEPKAAEETLMKKLDAASIEADLTLDPTSDGWQVAQVERVTGLALAERQSGNAPGFPRAGLIAAVRETIDGDGGNSAGADQIVEKTTELHSMIEQALAGKNLSRGEWEYVHRRVAARVGDGSDQNLVTQEVRSCIEGLDDAKRLYRRPPPPAAPAERYRGPLDYTNPEHNELIPR